MVEINRKETNTFVVSPVRRNTNNIIVAAQFVANLSRSLQPMIMCAVPLLVLLLTVGSCIRLGYTPNPSSAGRNAKNSFKRSTPAKHIQMQSIGSFKLPTDKYMNVRTSCIL